jgi:hypothetical protein
LGLSLKRYAANKHSSLVRVAKHRHLADGIPAADDWPLADVPALTLAEEGVLGGAGLLLSAVVTASAFFGLETKHLN